MNKFLFLAFLSLGIAVANTAHADDFLTREEIENSKLNDTEKGLAAGALLSPNAVIECVSTNEGIGADSERLRIYHIAIGNVFQAAVAVWKTTDILRVYGSFDNVSSLQVAYQQNKATVLGTAGANFSDNGLSVQYGHIVPMVGKVAELKFGNGEVASQICKIIK
ncbi:MAG: hypothetical protein ACXVBE_11460 [Bdellovibrionota bacterium]